MGSDFVKSAYFVAAIVLVWAILAIGGYVWYAGSALAYVLFSIVFLTLLLDGLYRPISLGYSFLVVFMWLGFWLKLISHLWLDYPFREPIGYFDGSPEAWDTVLNVSSVGALAVMLTKLMLYKYAKNHGWNNNTVESVVPYWYPVLRPWLWGATWLTIILLPIVNAVYGIFRVGLVPSVVLPWPVTGIIAWFMGFGLVVLVSTLVYWDHALEKSWVMGLAGVIVEGFLSALSMLSRAGYIFHTLPNLIVLFSKRIRRVQKENKIKLMVLTAWIFFLVANLAGVMVLRYSHDPNINAFISKNSKSSTGRHLSTNEVLEHMSRISNLIVDRWIGLEGMMAVTAYPKKNLALFSLALQEKRVIGKVDIYTKEISQAQFSDSDAAHAQYATLPGGIAFFYYTGSLWFVLVGMVCLTSLMLVSERVVILLTKNPYLCGFWGMGVAQAVASFGVGTMQMLTYYAVCFTAMGLIWIAQNLSPNINHAWLRKR